MKVLQTCPGICEFYKEPSHQQIKHGAPVLSACNYEHRQALHLSHVFLHRGLANSLAHDLKDSCTIGGMQTLAKLT